MNTKIKQQQVPAVDPQEDAIRNLYLESLHLVERLHRRLLDVIKDDFERNGEPEVNPVQALLLYNIADEELTAGELRTRGYYLGANVSHNVKKLADAGYLHHIRAGDDRRNVRISLTEKGREAHAIVEGLYEKHIVTVERIGGVSCDEFSALNQSLARLERFWTDQIRYRL